MIVIAQVASSWTHPKSALHFAHFRWQLLVWILMQASALWHRALIG